MLAVNLSVHTMVLAQYQIYWSWRSGSRRHYGVVLRLFCLKFKTEEDCYGSNQIIILYLFLQVVSLTEIKLFYLQNFNNVITRTGNSSFSLFFSYCLLFQVRSCYKTYEMFVLSATSTTAKHHTAISSERREEDYEELGKFII